MPPRRSSPPSETGTLKNQERREKEEKRKPAKIRAKLPRPGKKKLLFFSKGGGGQKTRRVRANAASLAKREKKNEMIAASTCRGEKQVRYRATTDEQTNTN